MQANQSKVVAEDTRKALAKYTMAHQWSSAVGKVDLGPPSEGATLH